MYSYGNMNPYQTSIAQVLPEQVVTTPRNVRSPLPAPQLMNTSSMSTIDSHKRQKISESADFTSSPQTLPKSKSVTPTTIHVVEEDKSEVQLINELKSGA